MTDWRSIKRKARREVHETLQVRALYLTRGAPPTNPYEPEDLEYDTWTLPPGPYYNEPVEVLVRIHTEFNLRIGDMKGTNFHYAERQEAVPTIIFRRDQVPLPEAKAVVSIAEGEAYEISNVLPPDDIFIRAEVTRLSANRTEGLPVPEEGE